MNEVFMMKKLLPYLLVLGLPLLSGCWDQIEVEQRSFIVGIGIDTVNPDELEPSQITEPGLTQPRPHQIRVAVEIPNLLALSSAEGGGTSGGSEKKPSQVLVTTGVNLSHSITEFRLRTNRQTFLGHLRLVLVSEDFAKKEGLKKVMDFFFRESEIHREVAFFIVKGKPEDILRIEPPNDNLASLYIENLRNMEGLSSRYYYINLGDLSAKLNESGNALVGRVGPGKDESISGGSAVIKDWRLAGFMGEVETVGVRFLISRIKVDHIVVNDAKGNWYGVRISGVKREITPIWDGETLTLEYHFKTEGDAREVPNTHRILDSKTKLIELQQLVEDALTTATKAAMESLQQEYRADAIELGSYIRRHWPEIWRQLGQDWENEFPKVKTVFTFSHRIRRAGVSM
jgi:Ger(x)C family germination protein